MRFTRSPLAPAIAMAILSWSAPVAAQAPDQTPAPAPASPPTPATVELRETGLPSDVFGQKDRQFVVKLNYLLQR